MGLFCAARVSDNEQDSASVEPGDETPQPSGLLQTTSNDLSSMAVQSVVSIAVECFSSVYLKTVVVCGPAYSTTTHSSVEDAIDMLEITTRCWHSSLLKHIERFETLSFKIIC